MELQQQNYVHTHIFLTPPCVNPSNVTKFSKPYKRKNTIKKAVWTAIKILDIELIGRQQNGNKRVAKRGSKNPLFYLLYRYIDVFTSILTDCYIEIVRKIKNMSQPSFFLDIGIWGSTSSVNTYIKSFFKHENKKQTLTIKKFFKIMYSFQKQQHTCSDILIVCTSAIQLFYKCKYILILLSNYSVYTTFLCIDTFQYILYI